MTALDSLLIMLKLLLVALGITDYCVITNFTYDIWLSQRQPWVTIKETASLNQWFNITKRLTHCPLSIHLIAKNNF